MGPLIAGLFHALKRNVGLPAQAEVTTAALRDLDGKPAAIEDHVGNGQWCLVVIWATTCHLCASEIPKYGAYLASEPEPKFSVVGVSLDGLARKSAIVESMVRWHMGFPCLVAEIPDLQLARRHSTRNFRYDTPTFMLFNPSGQLMKLDVGPVWIAALEEFIRNDSLE